MFVQYAYDQKINITSNVDLADAFAENRHYFLKNKHDSSKHNLKIKCSSYFHLSIAISSLDQVIKRSKSKLREGNWVRPFLGHYLNTGSLATGLPFFFFWQQTPTSQLSKENTIPQLQLSSMTIHLLASSFSINIKEHMCS